MKRLEEEEEFDRIDTALQTREAIDMLKKKRRAHYLEGVANTAKEYSSHVSERTDLIKVIGVVTKMQSETQYLNKIARIEKVTKERGKKQEDYLDSVRTKNETRQEKSQRYLEQRESTMRTKPRRMARDIQSVEKQLKFQEDQKMKDINMGKEKDKIKMFNHNKNIEMEKRKMEWKKLDVLAREKIAEQRVDLLKTQRSELQKSKSELIRIKGLERERISSILGKLKGADIFKNETKQMVMEKLDGIDVEEVFKQRTPKKKKKVEPE
jgi:hypothetical protein